MTQEALKELIADLRLNHEFCPKEVILQAADELERLAQPEQEPVAWRDRTYGTLMNQEWQDADPLYTHPPQRTWVELTGEEAMDVTRKEGHELLDFIYEYGTGVEGVEERIVAICKAIEAKLKEKNA